jgi:hypothetical protein
MDCDDALAADVALMLAVLVPGVQSPVPEYVRHPRTFWRGFRLGEITCTPSISL